MNTYFSQRRTFLTTALCILPLFSGCASAQTTPAVKMPVAQNSTRPDIGVGLEGLADWSRAMMFSDAMKTSRRWGNPDKPWENTVKTDALGWPTEDAGIVVAATDLEPGIYKLSFTGKAEISFPATEATLQNLQHDAATNRTTADVVLKKGQIMLAFRNTDGGVKNVQLLRPNADPKATFTKPFLEKLAPFSTLRFMDILSTNNNPVKSWDERTTPAHASQAREQGAALEYVVELANVSDKDIWVNVPDQADDNYVRQMATLLKNGLEKDRKVYVEWSNEVWNWQFKQATRNLDAAKIEGKMPDSPLDFDRSHNEGQWGMRRIAKRSAEVGKVFREVFGDTDFSRVRPVYATQVGYEEVYRQGLAFLENQYKQPKTVIYGLAGAPYFQISGELNKKGDITVDEIFAAIPADMEANLNGAHTMSSYARFYGLKTLAYEGGQHLQDHGGNGSGAAKVAANRDPRMGAAIEKYLQGWSALGGDLFMYFTLSSGYSKWGSWGLVEDINASSPKYEAVLKVLNSPKAPLQMGAAPGETVVAGQFLATSLWDKRGDGAVQIEPKKWFQYAVQVPKAGNYTLTTQISSSEAAKAEIWVNGTLGATLEAAPNAEKATVSLPLEAGVNVLRVRGTSGRFSLQSFQIEAK